jgi:hypothetical protein
MRQRLRPRSWQEGGQAAAAQEGEGEGGVRRGRSGQGHGQASPEIAEASNPDYWYY